uniref:Uncharacterized protein n=1 Tax=Lutzomyia longipalpis TaxID=7200 RepID=A0A1B0GJS8_LUTLO
MCLASVAPLGISLSNFIHGIPGFSVLCFETVSTLANILPPNAAMNFRFCRNLQDNSLTLSFQCPQCLKGLKRPLRDIGKLLLVFVRLNAKTSHRILDLRNILDTAFQICLLMENFLSSSLLRCLGIATFLQTFILIRCNEVVPLRAIVLHQVNEALDHLLPEHRNNVMCEFLPAFLLNSLYNGLCDFAVCLHPTTSILPGQLYPHQRNFAQLKQLCHSPDSPSMHATISADEYHYMEIKHLVSNFVLISSHFCAMMPLVHLQTYPSAMFQPEGRCSGKSLSLDLMFRLRLKSFLFRRVSFICHRRWSYSQPFNFDKNVFCFRYYSYVLVFLLFY